MSEDYADGPPMPARRPTGSGLEPQSGPHLPLGPSASEARSQRSSALVLVVVAAVSASV